MGTGEIVEIVLGAVIGIMGYFVKVLHSDVRKNTERVGENRGRLETISAQIEHEREMRNQSFDSIMKILGEIKEDIKNIKK